MRGRSIVLRGSLFALVLGGASVAGANPAHPPSHGAAPALDPAALQQKHEFCAAYVPQVAPNEQGFASGVHYANMTKPIDDTIIASVVGRALGCVADKENPGARRLQAMEWLDRGVESQLLEAYVVETCHAVGNDAHKSPLWGVIYNVGLFASCIMDVKKLDAAALEKEISAAPFNAWAQGEARALFARAKAAAQRISAEIDKKKDTDVVVKEAILDFPPRIYAQWDALYAANKDDIDFARGIEHKFFVEYARRGPGAKTQAAPIGCEAETHSRLARYVTSQHAKTPDDVDRIVNENVGNQLLEAVVECDAIEGRLQVANTYAALFNKSTQSHWRGPRALLKFELEKKMRADGSPWKGSWDVQSPTIGSTARALAKNFYDAHYGNLQTGVVDTVVPNGPARNVTFRKETISVEDRDCERTHIIAWGVDATPIWDYKCGPSTYHTEVKQPIPLVITEVGATLFQPGNMIEALGPLSSGPLQPSSAGIPTRVWADKSAKKLLSYYGVPLP